MLQLGSFQLIFNKINIILICVILLLTGCNKDVTILEGLDQSDANDIILLLRANNIDAKKIDKNKAQAINVNSKDETKALSIINIYGKPDKNFQSLGEIFKKDGFISSPTEEQARLVYGLGQEISNMISQIEGVITVTTQVAIPNIKDDLWDTDNGQPSVSILVIYSKKHRVDKYKEKIKRLASKSIPNLKANNVAIEFIPKVGYDIKSTEVKN